MKELYLLRGLPGCGKSTVAKSLNAMHFEADMFLMEDGEYKWHYTKLDAAHKSCIEAVEATMQGAEYNPEFERIVVSNTSVKASELDPYIELARKYDYTVYSLIVENRHGGENEHAVPEKSIEKMRRRFEILL